MKFSEIFLVVIVICFSVGILLMFLASLIDLSLGETKKVRVDCYDKYGSKIIGEQCIKEEHIPSDLALIILLVGFILFFPSLLVLMLLALITIKPGGEE